MNEHGVEEKFIHTPEHQKTGVRQRAGAIKSPTFDAPLKPSRLIAAIRTEIIKCYRLKPPASTDLTNNNKVLRNVQ